jgi:hypothetical protein
MRWQIGQGWVSAESASQKQRETCRNRRHVPAQAIRNHRVLVGEGIDGPRSGLPGTSIDSFRAVCCTESSDKAASSTSVRPGGGRAGEEKVGQNPLSGQSTAWSGNVSEPPAVKKYARRGAPAPACPRLPLPPLTQGPIRRHP